MKRIAATVHTLRRAACARAVVPFVLMGLLLAPMLGQTTPLVFFLIVAAWRLLEARRDRAAGGVLAWLTIKPQLTALLLVSLLLWAAQRRNLEAFSQASQLAAEGMQALARRQIELTRETFEGFSALLRDLSQPVSPEDRIAKNTDYAKQMLEKGVNHGREVVSIAAKTGADAAEVLQKRATESLDEMRVMASKTAA